MKIPVILGLTVALAPALDASAQKTTGKVVNTTLTKLRASPESFKNVWVRFPVQFTSMGKVSNPFFTQFVPARFANFHCWADEQPIWKKKSYENLFGLLFIAKDHKKADEIYASKVYDRMMVTGVVRNTFQGQPWIEVMDFYKVKRKVSTATLSHLYRGESFMGKRQWSRAISELSLAPGEQLPRHVQGQIHRNLAVCYLRVGEAATALTHIENAVTMLPTLDRETREMAKLAKVRPEAFLDRSVTNAHIEDHELPMWDAFENENEAPPTAEKPATPAKR